MRRPCEFVISKPGKDDRACANRSSTEVHGMKVCGIHANALRRRKP